MWVLIKTIAQSWDTEETVQHSYEIQYNNCNKVRFRHFDTQDLLRSKHSTFLLYIMRKSFWNENGWPVVFFSRRLTDVHGVYVSCADLRGGGGSGISPFLGKFKFNKFTVFNFWNGPWTRLENKIIPCLPLHLAKIVWIRARNWQRYKCTNTFWISIGSSVRLSELLDELNVVKNSYSYRRK